MAEQIQQQLRLIVAQLGLGLGKCSQHSQHSQQMLGPHNHMPHQSTDSILIDDQGIPASRHLAQILCTLCVASKPHIGCLGLGLSSLVDARCRQWAGRAEHLLHAQAAGSHLFGFAIHPACLGCDLGIGGARRLHLLAGLCSPFLALLMGLGEVDHLQPLGLDLLHQFKCCVALAQARASSVQVDARHQTHLAIWVLIVRPESLQQWWLGQLHHPGLHRAAQVIQ